MSARLVGCTKCHGPLPFSIYNLGEAQPCPTCGSGVQVEVFSALLTPPKRGVAAEGVLIEGESSCFFHPSKKAILPCDGCGRFLCSVCEIALDGQHLCTSCLESGKRKGRLVTLENRRTLYDSLALQTAVVPLIFFWFTIVTAPVAIYLAIRHWNAPTSVTRSSKWRLVLALIIAIAQVVGWATFAVFMFQKGT